MSILCKIVGHAWNPDGAEFYCVYDCERCGHRGQGDEWNLRERIALRLSVITIREAFGGLGKTSVPFEARMKWTKRTSVAAILKAMREAGYGTKDFRPTPQAA